MAERAKLWMPAVAIMVDAHSCVTLLMEDLPALVAMVTNLEEMGGPVKSLIHVPTKMEAVLTDVTTPMVEQCAVVCQDIKWEETARLAKISMSAVSPTLALMCVKIQLDRTLACATCLSSSVTTDTLVIESKWKW